ncbi:hypothetical protein HELRODRAFT_166715 [Helobdella robusta]|uniref:Uncharacterized protein n=1 Tax=Helobdella robusta TaxID=6412 RepID=T1EYF1_HELRO|nr:hypothetical protein HELRODRAFT_166715 [Helobdella robusta]ESO11700.1 hypothetical protein HELRODRAFT_166715 [Helobdella robusta]
MNGNHKDNNDENFVIFPKIIFRTLKLRSEINNNPESKYHSLKNLKTHSLNNLFMDNDIEKNNKNINNKNNNINNKNDINNTGNDVNSPGDEGNLFYGTYRQVKVNPGYVSDNDDEDNSNYNSKDISITNINCGSKYSNSSSKYNSYHYLTDPKIASKLFNDTNRNNDDSYTYVPLQKNNNNIKNKTNNTNNKIVAEINDCIISNNYNKDHSTINNNNINLNYINSLNINNINNENSVYLSNNNCLTNNNKISNNIHNINNNNTNNRKNADDKSSINVSRCILNIYNNYINSGMPDIKDINENVSKCAYNNNVSTNKHYYINIYASSNNNNFNGNDSCCPIKFDNQQATETCLKGSNSEAFRNQELNMQPPTTTQPSISATKSAAAAVAAIVAEATVKATTKMKTTSTFITSSPPSSSTIINEVSLSDDEICLDGVRQITKVEHNIFDIVVVRDDYDPAKSGNLAVNVNDSNASTVNGLAKNEEDSTLNSNRIYNNKVLYRTTTPELGTATTENVEMYLDDTNKCIEISNVVCCETVAGRRSCKGCPFNDDKKVESELNIFSGLHQQQQQSDKQPADQQQTDQQQPQQYKLTQVKLIRTIFIDMTFSALRKNYLQQMFKKFINCNNSNSNNNTNVATSHYINDKSDNSNTIDVINNNSDEYKNISASKLKLNNKQILEVSEMLRHLADEKK